MKNIIDNFLYRLTKDDINNITEKKTTLTNGTMLKQKKFI